MSRCRLGQTLPLKRKTTMTDKTKIISGSEVDQWLSCERKHYYAFGQPVKFDGVESHGIEPLTHSDSLRRGNFGHAVLEEYYKAAASGCTHNEAKKIAMDHGTTLVSEVATDPASSKLFSSTLVLVVQYLNQFSYEIEQKLIKPLAVEHEFRYEVPGTDLVFPFKPDAVIQDLETKKIWIWDHKFLYNFYTDKTTPIMPQLTRYAYALRQMGFKVDGVLYNMLSTRNNSKQPFRRLEKELNPKSAVRFWDEAVRTMVDITKRKNGDPQIWEHEARRTASDFNCKNCSFLDLCVSDLEDRRGRHLLINNFYKPNTYGYGKEDE